MTYRIRGYVWLLISLHLTGELIASPSDPRHTEPPIERTVQNAPREERALLGRSVQAAADPVRPATRIGLTWGATRLAHQDRIHTPFVHGGTSPISFGIKYGREGGRWMHFAEGRYSALTSRQGEPYDISHGDHGHDNLPHGFLFFEAVYGAGKMLHSNGRSSAAAGASIRFDLQAVFYRYGPDENFGYFISPSVNVWYARSHRISPRNLLGGRIEAPVLSWLARSPYLVNDDQFIENIASNNRLRTVLAFLADGSLVSWSRLQRLHAAIDYQYALSSRISAGTSYRFAFTRSAEPRPLISFQSSLNLTTSFHF